MLRGFTLAAACAAALLTSASACAESPAQRAAAMLAKSLTTSMRAYYDKGSAGVRITTVSCTLAANERSGHCSAHFTNPTKTILGVFELRETIDLATQEVHTKTVSARCRFAATGKPVTC